MTIPKSITRVDPKEHWSKTPEQFNKWRAENDLPILFSYFDIKLPGFLEWQKEYSLTRELLFKIVPISKVFKGDTDLVIIELQIRNNSPSNIIAESNKDILRASKLHPEENIKILKEIPFRPYLLWMKGKFEKDKRILVDSLNTRYSDTFEYNSWSGGGSSGRASLFQEFQVLKLGAIKLGSGVVTSGRNLDFVDLDELQITGDFHGNSWTDVSFSSARNIQFSGGGWHSFYRFYDCAFDNFVAKGVRIQDFEFINNKIFDLYLIGVTASKFKVANSDVRFNFDKCELNEFQYIPPIDIDPQHARDNYQKIRSAFQRTGKMWEAKSYYYLERYYETKMKKQYRKYENVRFPSFKNQDFKACVNLLWKFFVDHIRFSVRYIFSLIEYGLWGYGERPSRVLLNSVFVILIFSGFYFNSSHEELHHNVFNSLYFSVVTFTTLGFGDINPSKMIDLRLLCAIQASIGIIMLGLLVASFANRSKY